MATISIVRSEPSTFITTLADGPSRSSIRTPGMEITKSLAQKLPSTAARQYFMRPSVDSALREVGADLFPLPIAAASVHPDIRLDPAPPRLSGDILKLGLDLCDKARQMFRNRQSFWRTHHAGVRTFEVNNLRRRSGHAPCCFHLTQMRKRLCFCYADQNAARIFFWNVGKLGLVECLHEFCVVWCTVIEIDEAFHSVTGPKTLATNLCYDYPTCRCRLVKDRLTERFERKLNH
jgi:hypothetical protein